MNVRDSQWLDAVLIKRGFMREAPEKADFIIINTCSVREKPERKVKEAVRRLERASETTPLFCILGCVAQQRGEELFAISPQIRIIAGPDGVFQVPDFLEKARMAKDDLFSALDFSQKYPERERDEQNSASAFVNIMQGCDNFCSYCIVPFTRGRQKSRNLDDVVRECEARLSENALEITLLGQNVNAWGKDNGARFSDLLDQVARLPGLARLRYVTPHPKDMDEATIAAFARYSNLCPRLHLPLQSGSDKILKNMGRRYDGKGYARLVENLVAARPDLAFSTDIIVGFPGETEADFQDTLDMMKFCGFATSFSFCYSDRPGTRASLMPDKIPDEIKLDRLSRLQSLQEDLTARWLAGRVGKDTEILVEKRSAKDELAWQGRDPYGTIVNVGLPSGPDPVGKIIRVNVTQARRHTLAAIPATDISVL